MNELEKRVEALEKENAELKRQLEDRQMKIMQRVPEGQTITGIDLGDGYELIPCGVHRDIL